MKGNMLNKLLIICCLLVMVSCKAKKQLVAARPVANTPAKMIDNNKLSAVKGNQVSFATFSGKAHAKLDIAGSSNDVTLNIRISSGQKIWVSVTAIAGIEVARALITPDSILVINKLQGLYVRQPFNYIYRYTSRQVDYKTLEAIFVGNAIPQLLNDNTQVQADSTGVKLLGNLQDLVYTMIIGSNMKVSETDLFDQSGGQSLQVNNADFIQNGNRAVPLQINMTTIVNTKKIQMNIHYNKVDFDLPLEFPFSIPSGYDPAN